MKLEMSIIGLAKQLAKPENESDLIELVKEIDCLMLDEDFTRKLYMYFCESHMKHGYYNGAWVKMLRASSKHKCQNWVKGV